MASLPDFASTRVAVVGLGYVGLPLAVEFARKYPTIGFDIDPERIRALTAHDDATGEVPADELAAAQRLTFADQAVGARVRERLRRDRPNTDRSIQAP